MTNFSTREGLALRLGVVIPPAAALCGLLVEVFVSVLVYDDLSLTAEGRCCALSRMFPKLASFNSFSVSCPSGSAMALLAPATGLGGTLQNVRVELDAPARAPF
jgi:hypothetical protein